MRQNSVQRFSHNAATLSSRSNRGVQNSPNSTSTISKMNKIISNSRITEESYKPSDNSSVGKIFTFQD